MAREEEEEEEQQQQQQQQQHGKRRNVTHASPRPRLCPRPTQPNQQRFGRKIGAISRCGTRSGHFSHMIFNSFKQTLLKVFELIKGALLVGKEQDKIRLLETCSQGLPSIAQLVERWTVVGKREQTSIGRWFESGSKEGNFFCVCYNVTFPSFF